MYFFQFGVERTFSTFDLVHVSVLIIAAIAFALFLFKRQQLDQLKHKDQLTIVFGVALLLLDFSLYIWKWINGQQPMFPIPMHLCSWAAYLVGLSLLTKNRVIFEFSLYYGVTGGLLSLLVPEFGGYSFDHWRFYQFFLLHFFILALPIYQFFAYRIVLRYKMIYVTMGFMWFQALLAFFVNQWVENVIGEPQNMMFVYEPPVPLPGFLGQTPWYLFVFTILFLLLWNGIYYGLNILKAKQK